MSHYDYDYYRYAENAAVETVELYFVAETDQSTLDSLGSKAVSSRVVLTTKSVSLPTLHAASVALIRFKY